MRKIAAAIATLATLLSGCGVETASTAATVGKQQAAAAQEAKAQQEQIQKKLGESVKAEEAAVSAAGK